MKKFIFLVKMVILIFYIIISLVIWNQRGIILNCLIMTKPNIILTFVYTIGIIIFLLVLFVGLIDLLFFNKRPSKKIQQTNLKNDNGKYPICIKEENDTSLNVKKYYYKNNGLTLEDYINNKSKLEVALDMKIHEITYGDSTKNIIIYGTPYLYLKPMEYGLSHLDNIITNSINYLVIGPTGSGKTCFIKTLTANLLLKYENAELYLCDFKNYDFAYLNDCKNYYGYTDVVNGITEVYNIFKNRIETKDNSNFNPIILVIDEYATLLSNLGKKGEEIQKMVSEILFMGRSYNIIPIIGLQRADSVYFKNGSRDQFKTTIALGNLSKEQKSMLFNDQKDTLSEVNEIGYGYAYIDGIQFIQRIHVQKISDYENEYIDSLLRNSLL